MQNEQKSSKNFRKTKWLLFGVALLNIGLVVILFTPVHGWGWEVFKRTIILTGSMVDGAFAGALGAYFTIIKDETNKIQASVPSQK